MPTALARLASAAALLALSSPLPLLAQESQTTKPEAAAAPKTEAPTTSAGPPLRTAPTTRIGIAAMAAMSPMP